MKNNADRLIAFAREIAAANADFQAVKGPGDGDLATHAFMRQLRARAHEAFGQDYSEKKVCGSTGFAVDFYFPTEETIVEVALGLPNPASEFEKDVLKAIMAQEAGFKVRKLFFVSRAGAERKCAQPGRAAVMKWALTKHQLQVEAYDLEGVPRVRKRRPKAAPRVVADVTPLGNQVPRRDHAP